MEYAPVENAEKQYMEAHGLLEATSKALEQASNILKILAMFGLVGNRAATKFIDQIKPKVDGLAAQCKEMSEDIKGARVALQFGDFTGSARFQG
jgi:hypothetical protein